MSNLVQSGMILLFNHFESDEYMWSGHGQRSVVKTITFDEPYHLAPKILLAPAMLDCNTHAYLRYELKPINIAENQFDISFRTWADSQFARLSVSWIAMGLAPRPPAAVEPDPGFWDGV